MAPDDDRAVGQAAERLDRGLQAAVAARAQEVQAVVDAVVVDVPVRDLVDVVEQELVLPCAAHVAELERRVAHDLVLRLRFHCQVFGIDRVRVAAARGRARADAEAARAGLGGGVELAHAALGLAEGRVVREGQAAAQALAEEEPAEAARAAPSCRCRGRPTRCRCAARSRRTCCPGATGSDPPSLP